MVILNSREQLKLEIMVKVMTGIMYSKTGALLLEVTPRTFRRYLKAYREKDILSIKHGNSSKSPHNVRRLISPHSLTRTTCHIRIIRRTNPQNREVKMDLAILKKKISTFRSEGGKLRSVSDELLFELLTAWETWTGPASGFYTAIGVNHRKMASLIGRAKRLKRDEHFGVEEFKEIKLEDGTTPNVSSVPCNGAEVFWNDGRIIRFFQVELLLEFLKKAA